uniref:zinc-binding dehydrogenase n=1 Tax=Allosalinactinospora lopnorensis TaxID=1352348 RepID=UPI001F3E14EB|nr:zinc-binding dehydrogenase [Allosalinactinospora lopnorensis]
MCARSTSNRSSSSAPPSAPEDFAEVVRAVCSGAVRPLLAGTYPLRELPRAQAEFRRKEFFGKLVVLPSSGERESGGDGGTAAG